MNTVRKHKAGQGPVTVAQFVDYVDAHLYCMRESRLRPSHAYTLTEPHGCVHAYVAGSKRIEVAA